MPPKNSTYTEGDIDVLTRTIWGEARGESSLGQIAVALVIRNRVLSPIIWWGNTYTGVCKANQQFSCWNKNDPNYPYLSGEKAISNSAYAQCKQAALPVMDGSQVDITLGATHYHAVGITPYWTKTATRTVQIGNHIFYKDVK